jgi:hypothetical protein
VPLAADPRISIAASTTVTATTVTASVASASVATAVSPPTGIAARIISASRTIARCAALPLPAKHSQADNQRAGRRHRRQQFDFHNHNSPLAVPDLCIAQLFLKLLD